MKLEHFYLLLGRVELAELELESAIELIEQMDPATAKRQLELMLRSVRTVLGRVATYRH